MSIIYVTTQGAVIRKEEKRFTIEKEGEVIASFPDFKVDMVLIYGNVQITTQAMKYALLNSINIAIMNYAGKFIGKITSIESKNIFLRKAQFEKLGKKDCCLELSKKYTKAKIKNSSIMLKRFSKNISFDVEKDTEGLNRLSLKVNNCRTLNEILGIEGEYKIPKNYVEEVLIMGQGHVSKDEPFHII